MNIFSNIYKRISRKINYIDFLKKEGLQVGEGCEIYSSASFGSEPYLIKIGNHVRVNAGVQFITHDGGVWVLRNNKDIDRAKDIDLFGRITIGNNVHIGTNAIIMPNVTVGDNCIIGCGAIVTKNVPENSVVVGIPARIIETIDEYYNKNKSRFDYTKSMTKKEKRKYLENKNELRNNE